MSIWGHRISVKLIAVAVLLMVVGTLLAAVSQTPDREITLVARGMAFYLEEDPVHPNPTLTVKAGERVRVVLKNDDRGITHDFAVPALDAAVPQVGWNNHADVTIHIPDHPGRYDYKCQPHSLMMHGIIVVEP
jgi:plastocyanin